MRTKKLLAIVLSAGLATATLAGCSGGDVKAAGVDANSTPTTLATDSTTPTTGSDSTEAPAPDPRGLPARPYQVVKLDKGQQLKVYAKAGDSVPKQTIDPIPAGAEKIPHDMTLLVKSNTTPGWFEVYLPVRPNGSTGFVKAADVQAEGSHAFHLEISLSKFSLKLFDGDTVVVDTKIGVGLDKTPTPGGVYYTFQLLESSDTVYGPYAYGLSGFSEVHKTFGRGGDGRIGIHGTNSPQLIGQKASNGCIRLKNEDIRKLADLVPLGTPVLIEA